ncbi:MAG: response regulator [Bacteroidales bacterium]|nr:response regulator [Bacteroidales bacterium]
MVNKTRQYKKRGILKFFLFVLILILQPAMNGFAQKSILRFRHYTANEGLSQNMVDCILKDSKGFIWIGTWNGLNRFDGYNFTYFKQNQNDKNSVSNNFIYALAEDRFGNIWVGTSSGLNVYLYDENRFIAYYHNNSDSQTISSDRINAIIEDSNGEIWLGTSNGADKLTILDKSGTIGTIRHFRYDEDQLNTLAGKNVLSIYEDGDGDIWFGTDNGLTRYIRGQERFITYRDSSTDPFSLSENTVHAVFKDKEGYVWVGTNYGLSRLDLSTGRFVSYIHNSDNPRSLVHNAVYSIAEDLKENLIIGTLGGLGFYNRVTDDFTNYKQQLTSSYGLNNDFINCIYPDRAGNVWIGTERGGINLYSIYQKNFEFLEHEPGNNNSLSHKTVNSVWEDEENIWIGTAGGGLNKYNKKDDKFNRYRVVAGNPNSLASDFITSIFRDNMGNLWIGSWGGGLHRLTPRNTNKGIFEHFRQSADAHSLINDYVSTIIQDKWGNLWVGTLGGLDRYDYETGIFEHVSKAINGKTVNQVGCLQFDGDGNLWAGTIQGLFKIMPVQGEQVDPGKCKLKYFVNQPGESSSLSGNYVISICLDSDSNLWFGTYGNGLNKLIKDPFTGEEYFVNFNESHGLADNIVYGILEDNYGRLWLSTDNGLSRFNPKTGTFRNYYTSDGLQSNQFYWSAHHKNKDGKLFFGSMNGLNAFYPNKINESKSFPNTIITDLKIYNETVDVGREYNGRKVLSKCITSTHEIVLSYKLREFSFEFSALDFDQPEKVRYAYKMVNFDEHWTEVPANRRFATYTNLKGGDYTFMVKAINKDGLSDELPYRLAIRIIPPFWETWWFRIIAVMTLVFMVLGYVRYRIYALRAQKKKLEQQVKERTAKIEEQKEELMSQAEHLLETNNQLEQRQELIEGQKRQLEKQNREILEQRDRLVELNKKVQQINQQQLKFFTHISHEFRTPLTLISTPLEQIIHDMKDNNTLKGKLLSVLKNTQRLLHLINQLMEIRKVETGKIELRTMKRDIVKFVKNISQSFVSLANQRGIDFTVSSEMKSAEMYFDTDKVENIIYNILSNAFKYTPEKGSIELYMSLSDGNITGNEAFSVVDKHHYKNLEINKYVEITIADNGAGIEPGHIKDIFRRFYRVSSQLNYNIKGTGIGLFLVKEMVKAHKGLLYVKSTPGKGSAFSVFIPVDNNYLSPQEIINGTDTEESLRTDANVKFLTKQFENGRPFEPESNILAGIEKNSKPILLIVDDDQELRSYTSEYLNRSFNIIQATNGLEGLKMANTHQPEMIISDIMMPEMDGLELCNHIKNEISTSHIPLILLTARSEVEDFIDGLESGADDYIPKPFNIRILEAKIKSLIENRKRLRTLFGQSLVPVPKEITTTRIDEQFLQRTIKIVEDNMNNPEFSVQKLAAEMCVSRSLLHKKLTAIADLSANDFITSMRLKKAAMMLHQGDYNISEIAFEVGFNDPKYFSRCFKKHFGMSPSEYVSGKLQSQ